MGMIFLKVFVLQVIVAAIVIFILKKILDQQLQQLAIKKLDYIKFDKDDLATESAVVCAPAKISGAIPERVAYLCRKKTGRPVQVVVKIDPSLKGGLIIRLKKTVIDFSLIGRLKEGGMIRSK